MSAAVAVPNGEGPRPDGDDVQYDDNEYDDDDDDQQRSNTAKSYARLQNRHNTAAGRMARERRRQEQRSARKESAKVLAEQKLAETSKLVQQAMDKVERGEPDPEVPSEEERKKRLRELVASNRSGWRDKMTGQLATIDAIMEAEAIAKKMDQDDKDSVPGGRANSVTSSPSKSSAPGVSTPAPTPSKLQPTPPTPAPTPVANNGPVKAAAAAAAAPEGALVQGGPPNGARMGRRMSTDQMIQQDISTLSTQDLLNRAKEALEKKKAMEAQQAAEADALAQYNQLQSELTQPNTARTEDLEAQPFLEITDDTPGTDRSQRGYCACGKGKGGGGCIIS